MPSVPATSASSRRVLATAAALAAAGLMLIHLPADSEANADAVHAIFADASAHHSAPQAISPQH